MRKQFWSILLSEQTLSTKIESQQNMWLGSGRLAVLQRCVCYEKKNLFVYHMEVTPTKCVDVCVCSKPLVI